MNYWFAVIEVHAFGFLILLLLRHLYGCSSALHRGYKTAWGGI